MPVRSTRRSSIPRILVNSFAQRVRVAADGSCWIYAVLAGLGRLEHGVSGAIDEKVPLPTPSSADMAMDREVRAQLAKHLGADVLRAPDYAGERPPTQFMGSFGGITEYAALCTVLGLNNVVIWDEVDDSDVLVVTSAYDVYTVSPVEAEFMIQDPLSVHIAKSRQTDAHVEAYVYASGRHR